MSYEVNREDYQIEGRNAVTQALMAGRAIDKIYLAQGDKSFGQIIALAKDAGAVISVVPRQRLAEMAINPKHQGVIAACSPVGYVSIDDILQAAKDKGEEPFIIALDEIVDPHNLGAILRTANAAGAHGVIITKHRSVGLTATVAKTSAGAVEWTPVARVTNLQQALDKLKDAGLWIYGAAGQVANTYTQTEMTGPICLVIGSEGQGLRANTQRCCDYLVSIPMHGEIPSLNASVASAIIMYEIVRQRRK
ncbi:MAG: 23S rRNA (guanosine(2251)-2'-O)-methyltransferase RlmB [Oscillospiraceae bacterium]|nr:23S rRNA (guanosine(2251)-2'-O)-methyltransferase RlmB [Oscillospiraceae bacterium]